MLDFGSDAGAPNYAAIANLVRQMEPRALTNEALPDVITILQFMKEECISRAHANEKRAAQLREWEAQLKTREKEVELRQRAINLVLGPSKKSWLPWR